jgi:hypothetical protein
MAGTWEADPTGRHRYRFFDGAAWTEYVRDRGGTFRDPMSGASAPRPPGPKGPGEVRSADEPFKKFATWAEKYMQVAAERIVKRGGADREASTPVLDHAPSPSVLGQWSGLVGAVQNYALAVGDIPGGSEMVGILRAVVGSEDAQSRLLKSIDAKVDALVKGPYNVGRSFLSDAKRVAADDTASRRYVERAEDAFQEAKGQAPSVQSRSLAEYHLGLCHLLLGNRGEAIHWLAESHASAVAVAEELARCSKNVKVLRTQGATAATAWFYPAGIFVVGMKFKKMVTAERARQALDEMLPFVDCVAQCHNSLTEEAKANPLPALSLQSAGENAFELAPVAVVSRPPPGDGRY